MKSALIGCVVVILGLSVGVIRCDEYPPTIGDLITSAPTPSGTTVVWMFAGDNQPGEPSAAKLFYSLDGQASYVSTDMAKVGTIWKGEIPNPASGTVYFYVAARDGATIDAPAAWATQSPYIAADAMPPSLALLANAADEQSGDVPYDPAAQGYSSSHDMTSFQVGYSAGRIYGRMTTVGGDYPTNSGGLIPTYYYGYSVGLFNPDSQYKNDYVYSILYARVSLLGITPGLYRVDVAGQSLTRIGDIQYNISGGALTMSCLVSNLVNDPYFGAANPSGFYVMAATTQGVKLTGEGWAYDAAGPCNQYRETPAYVVGTNQAPVLSDPLLTPSQGEANVSTFRYQVVYTDPDNHLPVSIKVYIAPDGSSFTPYDMTATDYTFADGSLHRLVTKLPYGPSYAYYFEASDGMATVRLPATGAYSGPLVGVTSVCPAGWINPGWNWFSVPVQPFEPDAADVFSGETIANKLYRWDPARKTFELFPDDFRELELGRGYILLAGKDMRPQTFGAPAGPMYGIAIPAAGWIWIGHPQTAPVALASVLVRNEGTGVVRTLAEDRGAADPWLNWNFIYWDSAADTAKLCALGGDDNMLRPWYGYLVWSNTENLTLLIPQ
jgi:hypothetical protein